NPIPVTSKSTEREISRYHAKLLETSIGTAGSGGASTPRWNHIVKDHTKWIKTHVQADTFPKSNFTTIQWSYYESHKGHGTSKQEYERLQGRSCTVRQPTLTTGREGQLILAKGQDSDMGGTLNPFNMDVNTFRAGLTKMIVCETKSFKSVESQNLKEWANLLVEAAGSHIPR
ncbi:hypothetical protein HDU76_012058, partial [Blyttiomyces sp. JEL0837]